MSEKFTIETPYIHPEPQKCRVLGFVPFVPECSTVNGEAAVIDDTAFTAIAARTDAMVADIALDAIKDAGLKLVWSDK